MAANLQPITSDGGFTSGGNININNGAGIVTAINEDLDIIVQDEEDDGYRISHIITDSLGNNLARIQLDSSSFTINTDMTGGDYQWQFDGNTLQVTNDTTIRGFNANVVTQAMVSGGNPVASLQVVNSVNDPNIFSTFDATASGANIKVFNGGSNGGVEHAWQFDNDGNLTLPGNTFAVNYANGTQVSIGGGGNTGNVTFSNVTVQGDNNGLNLSAGADFTANLAYLQVRAGDVASHIHLDTGNNEAYDLIVGNDAKFVQVSSTGNIIMSSYDGNTSYTWTLDTTGNLILAGGNSVIQSIANSSLDPINPNVSTMILTPSVGYSSQSLVLDPTLPGHIHLRAPGANIDEPYANIFLGGEESSFEVGYGPTPNVFIHSGGNTWTFDTAGNLTFPRDAAGNTDPILTIAGGATPRILSADVSLAGPANLEITALNTIFTGVSGDAIKIYPDDGEIGSTANLQIWTNSGGNTEYSWTFDDSGNLTVPGNTQVSTAESTSGAAGKNISVVAGAADQSGYFTTAGGNLNLSGGLGATDDGGGGGPGGSVNITAGLSADPVGNAGNVVINAGTTSYTFNEFSLNVSTNPPASPAPILNGFGIISAPEFTNGNSSVTINANSSIWTFSSAGNLTLPNVANVSINYANGSPYGGGGSSSSIANGNSNVSIATSNGNVTIAAVGNTTMTVTGTGANVAGTLTSTGKIGYASGSTVTQTTNRGNGVTINALAGTIITTSASMVANQIDTFSVANDQVNPNTDIVLVQIVSPNFGVYNCIAQPSATISVSLTGFYINIVNISGFTTTSDAITIRFMVIKAPNA